MESSSDVSVGDLETSVTSKASLSSAPRRISTRSIKRKKFDDELVESSLGHGAKPDRGPKAKEPRLPFDLAGSGLTPQMLKFQQSLSMPTTFSQPAVHLSDSQYESAYTTITPVIHQTSSPGSIVTVSPSFTGLSSSILGESPPSLPLQGTSLTGSILNISSAPSSGHERKRRSQKKSKKVKPPLPGSTKDLGRWKAQDDLLLITAVQQTCDLKLVHLGCKFSCIFTLKEVEDRWYALLYDPILSKLAVQAMKQLHPDIVAQVQAKTLFSKEEENLLSTVLSMHFQNSQPQLQPFEALLEDHPDVFHPCRSAKTLLNHWLLMRQYHLLPDQTVQPIPKGDHVLNFSDAEDVIDDESLKVARNEIIDHELMFADRCQRRAIRQLECEIPKWQALVETLTGNSCQDFDGQTLAVLRGRLVRYLMRSKEITIGRCTKDNIVDVDLSLEGPAWKVSRRQAIIKLKNGGDFYLANEGKRPFYVDGKVVQAGSKLKLNDNSVVEISCLRFVFLINQELVGKVKQEAILKMQLT